MAYWKSKLALATTIFFSQVQASYWPPQTYLIPPQPQTGDAVFISNNTQGPFDGPKSSIVNSSVIEWWYFDATSEAGDQGIAVWFFNTSPKGLGLDLPTSNWLLVHSRFSDRTGSNTFIPASEVIVQTVGDGSSGVFTGTGSGWIGAPDLSTYSFFFDAPAYNISGNVFLTSQAPAHFAVSPATDPDAQEMNVANLGWAVSIPAGDATAYVEVDGKAISFNHGSGYHDHNWGQGLGSFKTWYAVHATVGPFSFTVVTAILATGDYGTTYLSQNAVPIFITLEASAVSILPWGNGTVYPPAGFDPQPDGCTVLLEDTANNVSYEFNFTSKTDSPKVDLGKGLAKWFGTLSGGRVGGPQYNGQGMFEWLDLAI